MLLLGSASRFCAASSSALSPDSSSSFCLFEAKSDDPEFLMGGTPPDWKLKILPLVNDGVLLNNPPVFGWFAVVDALFPNNPVVGLLANNPVLPVLANKLPDVFANKLCDVLEKSPLPWAVDGLLVVPLLVKRPENNPTEVFGFSYSLVSVGLLPFSDPSTFFTVTTLKII